MDNWSKNQSNPWEKRGLTPFSQSSASDRGHSPHPCFLELNKLSPELHQNPNGADAAVVPKWTAAMIQNEPVWINGDGETSRDFCYIANAVQANLLAATVEHPEAVNQVYNVAVGERTSLNELFEAIRAALVSRFAHLEGFKPSYRDFRVGDVRHSLADIGKARRLLGYAPSHRVQDGLVEAMDWYVEDLA
ncbi:NAD-dependent epimerase/dehydratase family protein [Allochromatium vinosum]|uniref:NAD-dependent epimerase/dehydratase family protein n=1 Tax=Allochromatium vinosum TaxID=1049 RepID=UPI001F5BA130|nr:NAD-dependent epimerase/dehydratase family protein [Allochromatium vinosum]